MNVFDLTLKELVDTVYPTYSPPLKASLVERLRSGRMTLVEVQELVTAAHEVFHPHVPTDTPFSEPVPLVSSEVVDVIGDEIPERVRFLESPPPPPTLEEERRLAEAQDIPRPKRGWFS